MNLHLHQEKSTHRVEKVTFGAEKLSFPLANTGRYVVSSYARIITPKSDIHSKHAFLVRAPCGSRNGPLPDEEAVGGAESDRAEIFTGHVCDFAVDTLQGHLGGYSGGHRGRCGGGSRMVVVGGEESFVIVVCGQGPRRVLSRDTRYVTPGHRM